MPPDRAILLLGSSLTALSVARVAHDGGYRCLMLDTAAGPAAATRTARFGRLPAARMESILEAARQSGLAVAAVVADSDRWLRFVREHRAELAATGWLVLHPGAEAIGTCLDKSAFLDWCLRHGLPAPRLYPADLLAARPAEGQFPLMIRPELTQHSSNVGLPKAIEVRDAEQLSYWLGRYASVRVTPNVSDSLLRPGLRQFSVGAARDARGQVRTFLAEKVRPAAEQCAGGTYVRPAECAGIEALAEQALHALDFFGVAEVEILHDPACGRSHLIEVNARPWLQFGLPHRCGTDLLGHALGAASARTPASRKHAWLYFSSDLYACFSRSTGLVRTGRLSLGAYLRSILGADLFATWAWRDPWPLLAALGRSLAAALRPRRRA